MAPTAAPPAPGAPYYTPEQSPPAGTPLKTENLPTLFTPLKIRGVTLHHRFAVSPMCTYSSEDGHLTDWHLVHLGQFAFNGAGLVIVEATAVEARGRISPNDSGLWTDSQIAPLKRIVDYVHSQGQKIGIQLAHAGRKASDLPPWVGKNLTYATPEQGGWPDDIVAPSPIAYSEAYPTPKELTLEEIREFLKSYAEAARRAVEAGFDLIEIHGAHGYLISEFLSPVTNRRTDQYGGSFENRTRLVTEVIQTVRGVIPEDMPLFLRVSATEWLEYTGEPSWDLESTIRLAKTLPTLGVDLLDVSSAGNNPKQKIRTGDPFYQSDLAGKIRAAIKEDGLNLLIGAVGMINVPERARLTVQDGHLEGQEEGKVEPPRADLCLVAKQFLREPNWVLKVGDALGVPLQKPVQYGYFLKHRM